jgi:prepilin-type N-terminal cleavage/methylation domain-containing protein/prepilin-type processing-associated H-X9-DG protein
MRRRGFTLVELLVVLAVIGLLLALLLPAIGAARAAMRRTQCRSHLKQIGVALHAYHASYEVFPFGAGADPNVDRTAPHRLYSAHSQLLPYLGHDSVFNSINFLVRPFFPDPDDTASKQALAGPNATAALAKIGLFICPSDSGGYEMDLRELHPWGHTNYRSCNGSTWSATSGNGLFGQISSTRVASVIDGTAQTAAFSEKLIGDDDRSRINLLTDLFFDGSDHGDQAGLVRWCRGLNPDSARGLLQDSDTGQNWLRANMNWTRYNHVELPNQKSCKNGFLTWFGVSMTATSNHSGGVNVLFADGSVRLVADEIDLAVWRAVGTISGGETVEGTF